MFLFYPRNIPSKAAFVVFLIIVVVVVVAAVHVVVVIVFIVTLNFWLESGQEQLRY